jgi:hypothetical protein
MMKRIALIAASSIALATVGSAVWPAPIEVDDLPAFEPVRALAHWDAGWYGEIAAHGYWIAPGQQSPVAFFPLYPMVVRAVLLTGLNRWVGAELVSLFFGVLGVWLFGRWARRVRPADAPTAEWLLLVYPFSVYLFGIVYSDALFLSCAVAAFLLLERDRPAWAAVFGALACLCRPVAPAVVIGLLARSVERRRGKVRMWDLVPALSGLGLVAWMTYLQVSFGDALAFMHVQGVPGWDQPPGWESWLKVYWFHAMFPKVAPWVAVRLGGHALVTVCALALVVPTFKRLGWGYAVYVLLVVGIPAVSSKDFQGLGRYVIAAFPLFLTLSSLLSGRPRLRIALLVVFAAFFVLCAVSFGAGAYVA